MVRYLVILFFLPSFSFAEMCTLNGYRVDVEDGKLVIGSDKIELASGSKGCSDLQSRVDFIGKRLLVFRDLFTDRVEQFNDKLILAEEASEEWTSRDRSNFFKSYSFIYSPELTQVLAIKNELESLTLGSEECVAMQSKISLIYNEHDLARNEYLKSLENLDEIIAKEKQRLERRGEQWTLQMRKRVAAGNSYILAADLIRLNTISATIHNLNLPGAGIGEIKLCK